MNGQNKFTFQVVVDFEISANEAASLLAENEGEKTVSEWLSNHSPVNEGLAHYNAGKLKDALGKYLASVKVEECRQLTMSADTAAPGTVGHTELVE